MLNPGSNHKKSGPKVRWTVELCKEAICRFTRFCEEHDQLPSRDGYQEWQKGYSDAPSIDPIEQFGSWNEMRLQSSSNQKTEAQNLMHFSQVRWTPDKCLFALLLYREQAGEAASETGYIRWQKGKRNLPSITTIRRRFDGSWKKAWDETLQQSTKGINSENQTPP